MRCAVEGKGQVKDNPSLSLVTGQTVVADTKSCSVWGTLGWRDLQVFPVKQLTKDCVQNASLSRVYEPEA